MNLIIRTAVAGVLVLMLGFATGAAVGGSTPEQVTAGPLPCCPPN